MHPYKEHPAPQPARSPNKEMRKAFNELVNRKKPFRVSDVEKITGNDYFGMLYARALTSQAKETRNIEWNQAYKLFFVLKR